MLSSLVRLVLRSNAVRSRRVLTLAAGLAIAAGSVVTDDVPARTLMAGVPARPIRTLDIPDGWRRNKVS